MRILKAEPQVIQKLKDAGLLEDVEALQRAQAFYTQRETLKEIVVQLAEDQTLPENPYGNLQTGVKVSDAPCFVAYSEAQLDMQKAGFMKAVKP